MTPEPLSSLILASASPRRRELLGELGVQFEIIPSWIDESALAGESPREYASRISREKATAVACLRPGRWVLGADTIVVVEQTILGKPSDTMDALAMLCALSGREHEVMTAVAFIRHSGNGSGDETREFVAVSNVRFRPLEEREMLDYIKTGEPMDKAGAYAIQGGAAAFVEEYTGSWSNIVGLPMEQVAEVWRSLNP